MLPRGGQRRGVGLRLRVEQRPHGGRPREALPGVLAVDVHQPFGGLAQLRHGGRAAVDPGAALALRVDGAAQQQGFVRVEAGLVEPGLQCRRGVEFSADLGAHRAFAHQGGVGAVAQRQLQAVDEDGLARAGFAGEHGEAGAELHAQFGHDGHVAQRQAAQHGDYTPPSYQRSLRRSVA